MGNGKSQPVGLTVEEKPFLSNNYWTLHRASYGPHERSVTVFKGVPNAGSDALDKFVKNLMVHRHPNILKYVASWHSTGQLFLATEEVSPLHEVMASQTPLQICVGLHSIVQALKFLHDKAASSHNNLCQASIYVTPEGQWRLGGLEYLCRFSDLSVSFLSETKLRRYDRGISPGEDTRVPTPPSSVDQFALGVLIEETVTFKDDEVPGASDFVFVAKTLLQATDPHLRPSLETLLQHHFFNHPFISVHIFLTELPLKSDAEKQFFFRELTDRLSEFDEEVVAGQLAALLLSRIVLLDATAQQYLIPKILIPKTSEDEISLFTESTYKKHIIPKLMSIFCVRDIQVRLTLLKYFNQFCHSFTPDQLNSHILPELLVGVKDTNDELVSATLRALADLVPILGSATVIGGKRVKHFSDGRPKSHKLSRASKRTNKYKPVEVVAVGEENREIFLCERPSPDGGEAPSTTTQTEDEAEVWDTWDSPIQIEKPEPVETPVTEPMDQLKLEVKPPSPPIQEDFFSGMEPVISRPQVVLVADAIDEKKTSKFDVVLEGDEGWGDDSEWADVSDN